MIVKRFTTTPACNRSTDVAWQTIIFINRGTRPLLLNSKRNELWNYRRYSFRLCELTPLLHCASFRRGGALDVAMFIFRRCNVYIPKYLNNTYHNYASGVYFIETHFGTQEISLFLRDRMSFIVLLCEAHVFQKLWIHLQKHRQWWIIHSIPREEENYMLNQGSGLPLKLLRGPNEGL